MNIASFLNNFLRLITIINYIKINEKLIIFSGILKMYRVKYQKGL